MIITVEIFRILIITKKMTGLLYLSCEKEDYTTVRFMLTKIYKAQNVSTVHHFGFRLQKKQKQKKTEHMFSVTSLFHYSSDLCCLQLHLYPLCAASFFIHPL